MLSTSGSSQALSNLSSCFDNIENNREHQQKRETRNRMTIYEKQEKCPGSKLIINMFMGAIFRIITKFRILRLTFHGKSASKY